MSWPANPVNGQRVQINGVLYEFNAANETWDRIGGYPDNFIVEFLQTPNLVVTGRATFTDAGNVKIQGGFANYVLVTDGSGNLSWQPQADVSAAGVNNEVQFNTNDALDSSASFTFDKTSNTLTVPRIASTLTTSAQPNITSVGTLTSLNVSGNATFSNNITANNFAGNFSGNFTGNYRSPGSNTELLFNNQSNIGASNKLTFDGTTLNVQGNVTATNANLGNLVTANFINSTLTVANQPNITRLGTLVNLTSSGNIVAPNFVGNIVGGNISGNFVAPGSNTHMLLNYQGNIAATSNITFADGLMNVAGNINAANITAVSDITATTLTGSLKTASQPNITSLGTLTGLNVTGNATISGNVTAANLRGNVIGGTITGTFSAPGNVTEVVYNKQGSLGTSSNFKFDNETLTVTGNTISGNVYANSGTIGASSIVGTIATANQTSITRVGTLVNAAVTGNVTAGNVYANMGTIGAGFLTGTLTTASQPNITSVGTITSLTVSGNSTSGNVYANSGTIGANRITGNHYTAPTNSSNTQILINNQGNITGSSNLTFNGTVLNVASNVNAANITASNVTATLFTGTLTTPSQPNVTSVGTLTSLNVGSNVDVANVLTANKIIANSIETDVILGQLTAPAGLAANNQVLFNLNGVVDSSSKLEFNPIGTATLTLNGNLTTGNANLGNRVTANYIQGSILPISSSQPNITTVGTLTGLGVDGPINIANSVITIDSNSYIVGNLIPVTSPTSATDTFTGDGVQTLFVLSVLPYPGDIVNITIDGVAENPLNYTILNKDLTFNTAPAVGAAIVVQMQLNTPIYDLGSPTARWRDLWLSGTTIKLGTATITSTDTGTIDTGGGEFQSEVLTSTATDIAPFIVYSNVMVGNLNVQYLHGYEPSTSNLANTIVLRDEFHNFEANVITARLEGNATRSNTVINPAQPNITSVGLLTHLDVDNKLTAANIELSSNISAEYFKGSGAELYNINGANVSEVPLATFATDAQDAVFAVDAETAQFGVNVTGCSQPNITSVGTLISLKVTGQIEAGSIDASLGNIKGANFIGGNVSGNISGTFRAPGGIASNTEVLFNKEGNIGGSEGFKFNSLVNSLTITGKFNSIDANLGNLVDANFFRGSGNNLSNIRGSNVNGEVAFAATANSVAGANVSGQVANSLVAGTVYTAAQPAITSVGTLTDLNVNSGTLVTSNPIDLLQTWNNSSVAFTGIKQVVTDTQSSAESLLIDLQQNVGGVATSRFKVNKIGNLTTGNVITGNIEGTIITGAQPFITSLGTLSTLTISANIQSGNANLGNLARANFFSGDGSLLTNVPAGNRLQNGTSNLQIVNNGNINIAIDGTNDVLTLGNVSGVYVANLRGNLLSGNANLGNLVTANFFAGNASNLFNIVGANVTGTVSNATHACTANTVTNATQTNITRLGTLTELTLSSIADPSLGNNVTASFFTGVITQAASAQPNITSVGRLTGLTVGNATANTVFGNGTITAAGNIRGANIEGNLVGNGSGITYLNGGVVNGDVPSAATATTAGTVLSSSQPNITSVNTSSGLTSLKVSGETDLIGNVIIRSNLTVQGTTITANATTMNVRDPIIQIGGNTSGGALPNDDGKDRGILLHYHNGVTPVDGFMGWDNDLEQFTFASRVSVTNEVVTFSELGNIRASYFLGNGSQLEGLPPPNEIFKGTSNVKIPDLDGNVTISANSVANIVQIHGNRPSIGNGVIVAGNLTATRYFGDGSQLTGVTTTAISNGTSNVTFAGAGGNITMAVGGVSNVLQIDSVGNVEIKGLLKTGTGSGGNIAGANVISANTFIGNLANGTSNIRITQNGNVGISSNGVSNAVIIAGGLANVLTVAGNIDIGSNWFRGNGALLTSLPTPTSMTNGTSNIVVGSSTDVTISANGQSSIIAVKGSGTAGATGANVSGYLSVSGIITSTIATGTAPLTVTSTTRVANLNVNYANVSDFNVVTAQTTGTLYPALISGATSANYALGANAGLSFNAATGALTASSFVGTATGPLANGTSNVSIASSGGNVTVSAGGTANLLTVTSTGILGTFVNSSDVIRDYATVSVSHDYNLASVLYVSGVTGALSLTFTNIPTTNSRALVIPVIVAHGATAMTYPTSISINGVGGQTINYLQGTTPTARTNKTEVLGLTLIRTASSTWVVLGLVSSYG